MARAGQPRRRHFASCLQAELHAPRQQKELTITAPLPDHALWHLGETDHKEESDKQSG